MARYIDAENPIREFEDLMQEYNTLCCPMIKISDVLRTIKNIPTADVVEVKHGYWKRKGQDIYCSVCGNESAYNPFGASKFSDYCPNCGAKMDGERK